MSRRTSTVTASILRITQMTFKVYPGPDPKTSWVVTPDRTLWLAMEGQEHAPTHQIGSIPKGVYVSQSSVNAIGTDRLFTLRKMLLGTVHTAHAMLAFSR